MFIEEMMIMNWKKMCKEWSVLKVIIVGKILRFKEKNMEKSKVIEFQGFYGESWIYCERMEDERISELVGVVYIDVYVESGIDGIEFVIVFLGFVICVVTGF